MPVTSSSALYDSISGIAESGFAYASDSRIEARKYNVIVSEFKSESLTVTDVLNEPNPLLLITNKTQELQNVISQQYPQASPDLIAHYSASLYLAEKLSSPASAMLGLLKEFSDIFMGEASFDDLGANFAGFMGLSPQEAFEAGYLTREDVERGKQTNIEGKLIDLTRKVVDLINPEVTEQATLDAETARAFFRNAAGREFDETPSPSLEVGEGSVIGICGLFGLSSLMNEATGRNEVIITGTPTITFTGNNIRPATATVQMRQFNIPEGYPWVGPRSFNTIHQFVITDPGLGYSEYGTDGQIGTEGSFGYTIQFQYEIWAEEYDYTTQAYVPYLSETRSATYTFNSSSAPALYTNTFEYVENTSTFGTPWQGVYPQVSKSTQIFDEYQSAISLNIIPREIYTNTNGVTFYNNQLLPYTRYTR